MKNFYDVIIIGGGPAGMSAGIYCKQMGLKTLLIEKGAHGGQIATTSTITNYLGFTSITGEDLSKKMHDHAEKSGIDMVSEEVISTDLLGDEKIVITHNNTYRSLATIISIGTSARNLGVDNEKKYIGKGVSYSSLKDRENYTNKVVGVVGGGNSAIEDALYLSQMCSKVYLIHRRQEFRGDPELVDKLKDKVCEGKIELVLDHKPNALVGEKKLEHIELLHIPTGNIRSIELDCVFVAIGRGADTDIIDKNIKRNESGYIITDEHMNTNLAGVYAVGDIRTTPLRQIVTAVADGAISAVSASTYVKSKKATKTN